MKNPPRWVDMTKKDCEELVLKLAREGKSASDIGRILRDVHGVPDVKSITGRSVTGILKENKLAPDLPEDFMNLIKKAVNLRKHLEKNTKDLHNKRGLALIESKIKRLQKHYKEKHVLPEDWYYNPETAALLVK